MTRLLFPELAITVYTGYWLEKLRIRKDMALILRTARYLVDGPFIYSLADPNLGYRGSSNQRVIDLDATRNTGYQEIVLENWDGLLIYDRGTLSGPPVILKHQGDEYDISQCGKV